MKSVLQINQVGRTNNVEDPYKQHNLQKKLETLLLRLINVRVVFSSEAQMSTCMIK